jgi:hypothetical protein
MVVPFVAELPFEQLGWHCPRCLQGLPKLASHVRWKAIQRHIKESHPDMTPQQMKGECNTAGKHGDPFWQAAYVTRMKAEHDKAARNVQEAYGKLGHKPVRYGEGQSAWYCKVCWFHLRGKKTGKCKKAPSMSHQAASMWKRREKGEAEGLANLFGKTLAEMDRFYGYSR